jgi:cellulose synthase/poly-beta-1,6-N-acetylglucosamine synthase-like glycosyltransferase/beta-glucanase (GH16 family)
VTTLLAFCTLFALLLAAYALGHYFCGLVFLTRRVSKRDFTTRGQDAISVLVPARNEGALAIAALESLFAQDHEGPVDIYLLVKDGNDTSLTFLQQLFVQRQESAVIEQLEAIASTQTLAEAPSIYTLTTHGNKTLYLALAGVDPKSEKINWLVAQLDTPYVAILDCDHEAQNDWLRTSLTLLNEQPAALIQGRRQPLQSQGFFSFWDSLHQHVGCELFNAAFTRLGLTVFFTGTTAVMRTALLKSSPLTHCITEDIDLSYSLFMRGLKVVANPYSGSHEETSPDLYSFLARRRRWASGHTTAFFKHLSLLGRAPVRTRDQLQFLFHGTHYLIVLGVFILHALIGVYFFTELSWLSQATALGASLCVALGIANTQRTKQLAGRVLEVLLLWAWFAPALIVLMNVLHAALVGDLSRAALPIHGAVQVIGLIGLCAPVIVLLAGLVGFGQATARTVIKSVITYPVAFYLDIAGILLGLSDCLTGQNRWRAVSRAHHHAAPRATPLNEGLALPLNTQLGKLVASHRAATPIPSASTLRTPIRTGVASPATTLFSGISTMLRPALVLALVIFAVGVLYRPSSSIPAVAVACTAQQFDTDPWITPFKKVSSYCTNTPSATTTAGNRSGNFKALRTDAFKTIDSTYWDRMDTTFFCNQAVFSPNNIVQMPEGGLKLNVTREAAQDRAFTAADLTTKDTPEAKFKFGRFETVFKPTKEPGVISSFFLYRFDPWQEIDAEFLGNDTSKILLNVFYNPGQDGDLYNYGLRGTPVVIDLGFDASLEFHRYAIEWEPEEIRWFVDDKLIHVRRAGLPTPIPQLPMRFHVNTWPICSEELAGKFSPTRDSMGSELKSVTISQWVPPPQKRLMDFVSSLKWWGGTADWRQTAPWLQR